jgi:hypothetical protein
VHPITLEKCKTDIQEDINVIQNCFKGLLLTLNVSKCKAVMFTLAPKGPSADIAIQVGGQTLSQVTSYKYLGIDMDERLTFDHHTRRVVAKSKQGIGALCRLLRKWASKEVLNTTISSIAMPALLYGIEVWFPPDQGRQKQVERVQKFAARLLLNNFNRDDSYETLVDQIGWLKIHEIVAIKRLTNVKKYLEGVRFIREGIFMIKSDASTRTSARLREKRANHNMQLVTTEDVKNSKQHKLAAAQTRALWNALDEKTINLPIGSFIEVIKNKELLQHLVNQGVLQGPEDV